MLISRHLWQPMHAHVGHRWVAQLIQAILDQIPCEPRDQCLSTVARRTNIVRTVCHRAKIPRAARMRVNFHLWSARVCTHAHATPAEEQLAVLVAHNLRSRKLKQLLGPVGMQQRQLHIQTPLHRIHRILERNHKRVSLGAHLVAAQQQTLGTHHLIVDLQRNLHHIIVPLPVVRRVLNVREHNRHLPCRRRTLGHKLLEGILLKLRGLLQHLDLRFHFLGFSPRLFQRLGKRVAVRFHSFKPPLCFFPLRRTILGQIAIFKKRQLHPLARRVFFLPRGLQHLFQLMNLITHQRRRRNILGL
eukprot:comp17561_c0_seq1/m.29892 comp17561_c0_seq1/g.29892  ORF comp17561_c0_seq1/g.29892 comp17561_c0_seq1/m.29892 type:complete len:302 (+) comp17561_c0_seq1:629-1534(+)